jgi:hypothetical protein
MATICLPKIEIYMVIIGFNVKWSDNSIYSQPMDNVWYKLVDLKVPKGEYIL